MKKIFNWTIGSAFRTFGRIIAYIFVGCLIAFLFHKSGISIYDLIGIGKVSALEIANSNVDYVNLTGYGGSEVNIVGSSYKTISTGQMHFALKYHAYINYTSDELPYTAILVVCANNTPIRTGQNNYTNVMSDSSQTMTAGASCLLDNQTTGTLYYLPLGKQNIAPNSQCVSPCNHFNDWSYTIATNSKIKFSSLMVFNEEDYLLFKNNVATIGKIDEEAQAIIDSQNQNTTDIIDSLGNLGQDIVDNANHNAENIINSQKVCQEIDKINIKKEHYYLSMNGSEISVGTGTYGITDYINIYKSEITKTQNLTSSYASNCYYNVNKQLISCQLIVDTINVPNDAYYARFTIDSNTNKPQYKICKNGNQATTDAINDLNDNLNNSDSSDATNDANDFFSNFTTNTHGLTGIITAPLSAIQGLTSSTCSSLHIPIPYLNNKYLDLPCMRDVYTQNFGSFMTLYDTITLGIISYWVMVRIFALVKDFKNPDHDEIEVMDL